MADQNNQDDDSVWNPPNQSQYVSVTTSSLDTTSVTPSSEQSYSRATTVQVGEIQGRLISGEIVDS